MTPRPAGGDGGCCAPSVRLATSSVVSAGPKNLRCMPAPCAGSVVSHSRAPVAVSIRTLSGPWSGEGTRSTREVSPNLVEPRQDLGVAARLGRRLLREEADAAPGLEHGALDLVQGHEALLVRG